MSHDEFEKLDREERLAILRFVQDRDGPNSPLYIALAAQHTWLLNQAGALRGDQRQ